jgi:hypothetical protein
VRKTCRWLHRETGFLVAGLTLIYAISGVAVNHVADWNPSYEQTISNFTITPVGDGPTEEIAPRIVSELPLTEAVKSVWRAAPDQLRVIVASGTYDVDLISGEVEARLLAPRPLLNDLNYLHLNHAKGLWTWVADAYAVLLATLALTGIVLVKGRNGLAGRGGVLLALGVILPVVYLVVAKYLNALS